MRKLRLIPVVCFFLWPATALAAPDEDENKWLEHIPVYDPPVVQRLQAMQTGSIAAREALQGVAVDAGHVYAVMNFAIGKYNKRSGERAGTWTGRKRGLLRHINSCYSGSGKLVCAHSNFPALPMASSIEIFDAGLMTHTESHSIGFGLGSLTWAEMHDRNWWVGFAHYDGKGGEPNRSSRYTSVARYNLQWQLSEQWLLPQSVLDRMAPHAASGGSFGNDGLLYLTGHDRPEMYVLALPQRGSILVHLATIDINMEGQAFAWDRTVPGRIIYGISRPAREIRIFSVPPVDTSHPLLRDDIVSFPVK